MATRKRASKGKSRGNQAIPDLAARKGLTARGGDRGTVGTSPPTIGVKTRLDAGSTTVGSGGGVKT